MRIGAEAVDLIIKAARRVHYVNGERERNRIITLEGAFHGRTLAALTATGQTRCIKGLPRFQTVPR
jgi:acetylornithine/N-succinyldiaminopimelate aminotransferase